MLKIKFTKRRDGSVISRFERADGTATWQRKDGPQVNFFAAHDLTHYALETTLGYRRGFYGLVAEGWDLSDFGTPWPRGPLPADAEPAELIAGLLDGERATGERCSAAEFNEKIGLYYETRALKDAPVLTQEELDQIRKVARELRARWAAVPPGDSLELTFDTACVQTRPAE
jgi:hypothetical protein